PTSLFVPWQRAQLKSLALSQLLAGRLQAEMNRTLNGGGEAGGYRSAPLKLLAMLAMPAVLVEIGNARHPDFQRKLASADFQNLVAATLASGVEKFRVAHERP